MSCRTGTAHALALQLAEDDLVARQKSRRFLHRQARHLVDVPQGALVDRHAADARQLHHPLPAGEIVHLRVGGLFVDEIPPVVHLSLGDASAQVGDRLEVVE